MSSEADPAPASNPANKNKFVEITLFFFRLGMTGFGGPLALIAEMQKELVERRGWMSMDEFRQAFAVIKSMPGPVAYQTATFFGYKRAGFWGGLIAGTVLLVPATLLMIFLAMAYEAFQKSPDLVSLLAGFQMGALVLIALALQSLTRGYLKSSRFWWLAIVSGLCLVFHIVSEPIAILLAAGWSLFLDFYPRSRRPMEAAFSLGLLVWICLKAGAVVFGTGLAIVPLLENDFVRDTGWITHQQFMDALAFGQLTPGPVSVTVTFVGYKLDGLRGALAATVAIFFPAGFHQLTWFPRFVVWLSRQKWIESFVLGATAAITAGIVVSILNLAKGVSAPQMVIFVVFLLASLRWKIPSWGVVLMSGCLGWIFFRLFS
jgi:chromate transporter